MSNKKIPITIDKAWEILAEDYSRLEVDSLVQMLMECMDNDMERYCAKTGRKYEHILQDELDAAIGDNDYVVMPDNKATEVLYGKK